MMYPSYRLCSIKHPGMDIKRLDSSFENAVEELQKLLDILNYIKANQMDDD